MRDDVDKYFKELLEQQQRRTARLSGSGQRVSRDRSKERRSVVEGSSLASTLRPKRRFSEPAPVIAHPFRNPTVAQASALSDSRHSEEFLRSNKQGQLSK